MLSNTTFYVATSAAAGVICGGLGDWLVSWQFAIVAGFIGFISYLFTFGLCRMAAD